MDEDQAVLRGWVSAYMDVVFPLDARLVHRGPCLGLENRGRMGRTGPVAALIIGIHRGFL
ncbi:hypothetical protein [Methylomagnum ishizawai]|uniref:hypothetical protein n=1 Tax=Methylomagnum ishizawai TaxID=1760988 RepID=UPI001C7E9354|nr:hypothetical protein [Methylomagnum ishizawai]